MSLRPRDIRVGNNIRYSHEHGEAYTGYVVTADIIHQAEVYENTPDDYMFDRFGFAFEGIPLTPDILLNKCGFEKIKGYYVNKAKDDCHIAMVEYPEHFSVTITGSFGMVDIKSVRDVHQLQNVFYFLTGEELKYEP